MATSGALSGFLSAMLQLRAQRLQEAEAKAKAQSELMSGIGAGIGSLGKDIGAAMQQGREDQMYNKLSTEAFGQPVRRATSANAGVQSAADLAASRMPGGLASGEAFGPQFTGGKAGFEGRLKLMELKDKISTGKADELRKAAAANRAERYYDLAAGKAAAAQRAAELKARNDAFAGMSKQAKEIYGDTEGYLKSAAGIRKDLDKALEDEDSDTFNQRATELEALNAVHKGRKLTTPLIDVPAYFPKSQQKLLDDYTAARAAAQGAPATSGIFGRPSPEARALGEAGAAAATGGPGGIGVSVPYPSGAPRYAPPATVLPADLINRASQGGQVSPQEFQQITGAPSPGVGGAPPAAAAGATARAAPGTPTVPIMKRNPNTGQIWNPQNNQIWNPKSGQWETR